MIPDLALLFTRDLNRVMAEIRAYPDEDSLWQVAGQINNSAGNLTLHLVGNISQFIGDDLGDVPFARNREAEFTRRNVPRAELLSGLQRTSELVEQTLAHLNDARLDRIHPRQPPGFPPAMTSRCFLLHLYGHLNYHLGQINYHRRLTVPED